MPDEIGPRVAGRIAQMFPDRLQKEIAERVGMTPDAFSRSLSGHRAFSALEVAKLADLLNEDVYWIITGEADPHRMVVAARHDFDPASGAREVPGAESDEQVLRDVALTYRQAYRGVELAAPELPADAEGVRAALGQDFVRPFIDRLESRLDVDVVRMSELSTSYCMSIAGKRVIVIAATGNWFRENYSIAHELGHIVARHLCADVQTRQVGADEAAANAFAAELLMPRAYLAAQDWEEVEPDELAARVWELGVSTDALIRRLRSLGIAHSERVRILLDQSTQRLLRRYWLEPHGEGDAITRRMDDASARRFPVSLQEAHLKLIAHGALGSATLAWMLGIRPEELEVDTPPLTDPPSSDELAHALGLQA
jgi:transcriptional regulator with XRE-family HTH domain